MTKLRDPMTFEDAIIQVVAAIGWSEAAKAVGKSESLVRAWADPDDDRQCQAPQGVKLDIAYRRKTGDAGSPCLAVFAYQIELGCGDLDTTGALIETAAKACKETGEALGALMEASRPGAPQKMRDLAARETEEAIDALTKCRATLSRPPLKAVG